MGIPEEGEYTRDRYTREGGMDIPEGGGKYTRGGMSMGIPTPNPRHGTLATNPLVLTPRGGHQTHIQLASWLVLL